MKLGNEYYCPPAGKQQQVQQAFQTDLLGLSGLDNDISPSIGLAAGGLELVIELTSTNS